LQIPVNKDFTLWRESILNAIMGLVSQNQ